jgi:hypothetical protein
LFRYIASSLVGFLSLALDDIEHLLPVSKDMFLKKNEGSLGFNYFLIKNPL